MNKTKETKKEPRKVTRRPYFSFGGKIESVTETTMTVVDSDAEEIPYETKEGESLILCPARLTFKFKRDSFKEQFNPANPVPTGLFVFTFNISLSENEDGNTFINYGLNTAREIKPYKNTEEK